MVFGLILK